MLKLLFSILGAPLVQEGLPCLDCLSPSGAFTFIPVKVVELLETEVSRQSSLCPQTIGSLVLCHIIKPTL